MKLFGFYITRNNWRHKFECASTRANRNAQDATQYRQSLQEARKELNKTNAQMEAARLTHEREIEEMKMEVYCSKEEVKLKEEELEKVREQRRDLEKMEVDHKRTINKYEEDLKVTRNALEHFKDIAATKEAYIGELQKQIYELKAENTKLGKNTPQRVKDLEEACDKLIDENHEYSHTIEELVIKCGAQQQLLVEMQTELEMYKKRHEHKVELQRARQKKYKANKKAKNIEQKLNTK